jgi:hypothetical protein
MSTSLETPIIFTPSNEPYLGQPALLAFDKCISAALAVNQQVAPQTHGSDMTDIQKALGQLIPAAISISLSIRELIRQGYVYGALVLLRPLAERSVAAEFLHQNPIYLPIWFAGWDYKKRPGFAKMVTELWGNEFPNADKAITKSLKSLIHGDPESSKWNLILSDGRSPAYAVSKILDRPDICNRAALVASTWLSMVMVLMAEVFLDSAKET